MPEIRVDTELMRVVSKEMENCHLMSGYAAKYNYMATLQFADAVEVSQIGNLKTKMLSLAQKMDDLTERLENAAVFLEVVAESFEEGNRQILDQPELLIDLMNDRIELKKMTASTNLREWNAKATDSEYALISGIWNTASTKENSEEWFLNELLRRLPPNSPLNRINSNYVSVVKNPSGIDALILTDSNGNATVVFSGMNGDADNDDVKDIIFGNIPEQRQEAIKLVNDLSDKYQNITVAGHSLGGYLATSVTIDNPKVSRCVALDPLGQPDSVLGKNKELLNDPVMDKISTYNTAGIVRKLGGTQVGQKHMLDVPWRLEFSERIITHNIDDIYNAMGGYDSVNDNWTKITTCPVE